MTDDPAKQQAIDIGRSLEKRGQVDAAVKTFLRVGAVEEAARALAAVKRYADAGHIVLESLGVAPALFGGLDPERRKLATKAAVCFAQAGDQKRAVEMFLALGDPMRAAEVCERAGDKVEAARIRARLDRKSGGGASGSDMATGANAAGRATAQRLEHAGQLEPAMQQYIQIKALPEAARIAYKLKKYIDAAQLFEDAGMLFEAAKCFADGGDAARCLEAVVRVPREHPKYRLAAAQAIRLATDVGVLDFKLDHFLGPYVAEGPKDERDLEAFYALAKLYRARDFLENAREVYRKMLKVNPAYRDVQARLDALDTEAKGSRMAYEQIVREDAKFHGDARQRAAQKSSHDLFPDLPDLPELPSERAVPAAPRTAYGVGAPVSAAVPIRVVPDSASGQRAVAVTEQARVAPATARGGSGAHALNLPSELVIGATVAERYRVEAKIGQGGMAAVYRATDLELGEEIAIKLFLQPNDDPQLLARFKQELTLSRNLAHPNIVRLYDIGIHQGCRFITMELLTGTDLGAIVEGQPLELARGLRYMIQACAGLAVAHDKGVVHRDIKPANFFVTKEDTLKVMDFGIAKKASAQQAMTQAGFIAGTPAYMSPEQINNFAAVSYRTDIYALGVVAYEIFTGAVPFDSEEMMQLLMMHLTQTPEPPRKRNPALPQELEDIILKCLEKDPQKRVQSCHELEEAFKAMMP